MSRVFGVVATALPVLAAGRLAHAQPPVRVEVRACPGLDARALSRAVSSELGATEAATEDAGVTHISVRCTDERAQLRVSDPLSRKHVRRAIHLGGEEPGSQLRLIALAATELVLSSWAELVTNPTPVVEPDGPPPPEEVLRAARELLRQKGAASRELPPAPPPPGTPREEPEFQRRAPARPPRAQIPTRLRVLGVVATRGFLAFPGQLWGGGLRVGADHVGVVSWTVDALHEQGPVRREPRRYLLETSTVGASVAFSYKAPAVTLRSGAALRAGLASSLLGDTTEGGGRTSAVVPWGWPSAIVSATLWPGSVAIEAAGELGYAVVPLAGGSDSTGASLRGAWVGFQVGLGFSQSSRATGRR